MQFDEAKICVSSGAGGDGMMSFRREKYVPRGGPSGGDGGDGGDVILRVDPSLNTLLKFHKRVHFKAEAGKRGGSTNMTGARGDDVVIGLPPGTVVRNLHDGQIIADMTRTDDEVVVLRGGRGGRGNARFKTSANQAPRMAEKGQPGKEQWLRLELKLIADVGLVGVPNAGKSTLLSVLTNAKPKIAAYPFTTIEPNLGVMMYHDRDLVLADIPGLIEGAHMGVGLGHSFLRHVQRTRLLVHLIDGMSTDPIADYNQINVELALFDDRLKTRPQIVVYTKMDLPDVREKWDDVRSQLQTLGVTNVIAISSAVHENIDDLMALIFAEFDRLPVEVMSVESSEQAVYELEADELEFDIERVSDDIFRVRGTRIETAAAMTYWENEEAVLRFQKILETTGVSDALKQAGVSVGSTVFIGEHELEWSD